VKPSPNIEIKMIQKSPKKNNKLKGKEPFSLFTKENEQFSLPEKMNSNGKYKQIMSIQLG
jgi:hypothetical protein